MAEGGDDPVIKSSSTLPDAELEHCLSAKFHFVDLAGSERVSKTGNQGLRFKGRYPTCTVPSLCYRILQNLVGQNK